MKNILANFSGQVLSRGEMKDVKGGVSCEVSYEVNGVGYSGRQRCFTSVADCQASLDQSILLGATNITRTCSSIIGIA